VPDRQAMTDAGTLTGLFGGYATVHGSGSLLPVLLQPKALALLKQIAPGCTACILRPETVS
jgi:hypothetical protein